MVPPHMRANVGLEPAGRALEPAGRSSEPAGRVSEQARSALEPAGRALEPAKRASEPARRALEPARRALEPAGRPGASWEGQLRGRGGDGKKERTALPVCGGTIGPYCVTVGMTSAHMAMYRQISKIAKTSFA